MSGSDEPIQSDGGSGEERETTVLEQWKFYGQSTQQVSNRRLKNNRFYLRLLIALLGVAGIGNTLNLVAPVGVFIIGMIGLSFSVLWAFHILSYKQLNSGKYRVLWSLAEELPYDPFRIEWERLKEGTEPDVYIKHTTVEVWWPRVFGAFYAIAALWGGLQTIDAGNHFLWLSAVIVLVWVVYALVVLFVKPPMKVYWDYTGD